MAINRADRSVQTRKQALRLAKCIAENDRSPAVIAVGSPPVIDRKLQHFLRRPAINGQAESGFGNESMTAQDLDGPAGFVRRNLIVSRHDPNFALMLQANLG